MFSKLLLVLVVLLFFVAIVPLWGLDTVKVDEPLFTPQEKKLLDSLRQEMLNLKYGGAAKKTPKGYMIGPGVGKTLHQPGYMQKANPQIESLGKQIQDIIASALEKQDKLPSIYDNDGKELLGKRGQEDDPNYVTAEVEFSGEFATVDLNKFKGRSQKDVTPFSEDDIKILGITPILDDTTKTPASYGWWINQTLDRLTIKSSNANDSSKVRVWMMVQ